MVTQQMLAKLLVNLTQAGVELWVEEGRLRSRAPEGAITPILREQIRLQRDEIITLLQQHSDNPTTRRIRPTPRTQQLPLSFAQQRLWFLAELGNSVAYNMPLALEIEGKLAVTALQQTLSEIVQRHESLRTTFVLQEGVPYQVIHPARSFDLPVVDLRGMVGDTQTSEVKRLSAAEALRPFDLSQDLMLRAQVLQLAEERFVLLLTMHHIAADGWSLGVLVKELATLYAAFVQGKPSPLPELAIQYADFAVWQRNYLQGEVMERQLTWWKAQLADAPDLLQLPTDRPRPAQQSFRGEAVAFEITAGLTQQLRQLSQQQGCTLYMTLLTAFQVLLHRYTGQAQIVVGSPIANRNHQEVEGLIGFFVNTMALRTTLSGNPSFLDVLAQVQSTTQAAYDHQELPFERLVEEMRPERNRTYNPLVQVIFALQNAPMGDFTLPRLRVKPAAFEVKTTRLDIETHVWEVDDQLKGYCVYAADLFAPATIERMMGHFQELLKGIVADPTQSISSLPLLTKQERHQLLVEWNNTATDYPKDTCPESIEGKTLHQLFEEQVERTPDTVAVVMAGGKEMARLSDGSMGQGDAQSPNLPISQSLTYAELNARANQLAQHLQSLGVGPETLVGICVERSLEMVVGLLGILKAGGAYLPLDPTYPQERLAFMLQDANTPVLLTQQHLLSQLPMTTAQVVCLDRDWPLIATLPSTTLVNTVQAEHLAYVIYTSGSTGRPKGVMNTHHGLCNVLQYLQKTYKLTPADKTLQTTVFSFDVASSELFWPILNGASLVLTQPDGQRDSRYLVDLLQRYQITTLHVVPSLLQVLLEEPIITACTTLKRAIVAGEALPVALQDRFFTRLPHTELYNLYGPTETAIYVTAWHCQPQAEQISVPIGHPIANTQMYVLDHQLQPMPIGVPGELHIGGVQVGRGYLNRPELTREKFIPNPFDTLTASPFGAGRLYKTGDLCRWLPDGNIEYLGRIDHQVKLRGFRIELGEIEAVLRQHSGVQEAIVVVRQEKSGEKRLVAYVVPDKETRRQGDEEKVQSEISLSPPLPLFLSALRSHLQAKLPDYMRPSAFVLLDALPLTPNGKVDRKALPAPEYVDRQSEFVAPRTALEAQVAAIWQELLHVERVGVYDNFFALGGHSLLATQVIAKIRRVFAIELELSTLFASPTIAAQTQALLARQQEGCGEESQTVAADRFPEIVHAPAQRHEPFPLTDVQYAYWVGRSAGFELGNISAHLYFELEAEKLDVVRLNQAWQRLVERHEMLRCMIQPDGQQRILPTVPRYEFALVNLQNVDENEATQTLDAIRAEMSHQVLPADQWPLFDIRVTRLNSTSHRLHISLDALILDGTSIGTLVREWVALYQQPQTMLPPLTVSFRDYVFAERAFEQSAPYQQAWAYWQKRLPTLPPAPDLPLGQEAQAIQQPHFNMYRFRLEATAWSQLKRYGNGAGLTNSALILSAFAEILTAWSKEPHYTLNLTLFNRLPLHPQINDLVGDFTPLLLLEVDHRSQGIGEETFATRAQRLQQQLWRDLDQRVVNGVRVLRELAKRQDRGSNRALMPVVFTSMLATPLDNTLFDAIGTPGYMNSQTPQVWLDHVVIESAGALDLSWSVVEELFPAGMVAEMFAAYCTLLQRLASDETAWHTPTLTTLPVAQQAQRQAVNDTAAPIANEMLHTLFLQQVAVHATDPAVITPTLTLTYAELYQRANQIGHWLRQAGAKPNTLVGVVMEKGWEQVVAVLGIHLAGAAYLPIDPELPTERQHYLLAQGMARIALTQSHIDARLPWPQAITRLPVDALRPDTTLPALAIVQTPTDLAYVIYTSGSTGHPKGVVIDHRGAVNTVLDVNQRYGITANDRVLALSALNFDLSVYDIFGLLAVGGSIVLPDPERRTAPEHWHELIHQHHVTLWNTVPALMQMLVEYEEETRRQGDKERQEWGNNANGAALSPSSPLRTIMMSGDWIPVTLPDRIRALYPAAHIYSLGGATEASIWSIDYPIEKVDPAWPSIPYGKPMVNQTFHVLDANLNPRPTWVPGNLYIGGIGLALGYWQDAARTNASFIVHPQSGKRLYKTGDLGRYLPDGNIEFLGREDFQVKIRGHRIELGEIESALLQHKGVREAVVNAVGDPKGHRQLVGYVVLAEAWQGPNQSKDADAGTHARPDVYDHRHSVALTDPVERLEFKLRQPGIRDLNRVGAVVLPTQAFDESRRQQWLAHQSHRQFLADAIDLHCFSAFLSCLMQMPMAERPLPKYRYPSAGNLYPVQCYLYIKPERITGLAGGYYYYQPADHQLIPLPVDAPLMQSATRQADQTSFAQSAFILFLVAELAAIAPMHGDLARDFSLLEAGYISQLLMMEAPHHALGLCPLGGIDPSTIQTGLALGSQHQLLHSLVGGRIDPQRSLDSAIAPVTPQSAQQTESGSWQSKLQAYLAEKLPTYMVPTTLLALPALPLTANGKVDRKALPIPAVQAASTGKFTPPSTETEQLIANLWCELLGVQQVGLHDDFFGLGGDSLIATQVRTRLRAATQLDLPLRTFFEHATLYQLAEEIEGYRVVHKMQSSQTATHSVPAEIDREEVVW